MKSSKNIPLTARKREMEALEEVLKTRKAQFIAVYGRRRVGKTFLVRNFFAPRTDYFEITGRKDASLGEQIDRAMEAYEAKYKISERLERPNNWRDFFKLVTERIKRSRRPFTFFIDELPWLASPKSMLLEEIDHFWNTNWSKLQDFKLVICGSASAWIIEKIVNSTGGLYNRLTQSILLQPLSVNETKEYLEAKNVSLNKLDLIELYMIFGGVPYYLDLIQAGKSVAQNTQRLIFDAGAPLRSEMDNLFQALFRDHENHEKIIRALAANRYGISRQTIENRTKIGGGNLVRCLSELVASSFAQEYVPYGRTDRDLYYRLTDEFTYFYFSWIGRLRLKTAMYSKNNWLHKRTTPQYYAWAGYSFESFCQKHVGEIIKSLGIDGISVDVSTWRYAPRNESERGAQIDLLLDRADRAINLCEIKYSGEPVSIDRRLVDTINHKIATFRDATSCRKTILPVLISATGVRNQNQISPFVRVLQVDDIV